MADKHQADLRQAVIDFFRAPGRRPATVPELARALRIDRSRRRPFRRVLRDLVADETLVRLDRLRYGAAGGDGAGAPRGAATRRGAPARPRRGVDLRQARGGKVITGRISRNPRGFGFVTPDAGGPDLFIPPPALGDLLDGDRVAVEIVRRDPRGRSEGRVVKVLERSRKIIMGVFHAGGGRAPGGGGEVEAYDRQFEAGIVIPRGEAAAAEDGLVVGVQITRPPVDRQPAHGRVVEVLGRPDEPGMDLETVVRKYELRRKFAPDVVAEAEAIPEKIPKADLEKREDFRRLPIVTIDGETAKDFDDAVLVARNADGTYELQVHIADVAHYVRPSTPLDQEAYDRGTSVYFPGIAIPMLPERLSNGICSLNPGVDRLVQSCVMTIDRQGQVVAHRFAQGVIRTVERMTYTDVARILVERHAPTMERYRTLVPGFRLMEELCGVLRERRRRRGSIDFDLPEGEIVLGLAGEMTGIVAVERNIAHRLIEEFMLAANETVASHLWRARVPSLYRIHEKPDPKKLEEFDRVARAFGYRVARPFESIEPRAFQEITDMVKGRPEERFLSRLMLRSLKLARYSEKRDIHFGLATSCYTHFTSPIRRYPDLVVHRMLKRVLAGGPLQPRERHALEGFLPEAGLKSSRNERTADAAENELIERKKAAFMAERVGEEFDGFIIGVQAFGVIVELVEYFIDGVVPVDSLHDDRYRFHEKTQTLKGDRHGRVFKLGDRLRVRVDRVNQILLQIEFSLVESERPRRRRR